MVYTERDHVLVVDVLVVLGIEEIGVLVPVEEVVLPVLVVVVHVDEELLVVVF